MFKRVNCEIMLTQGSGKHLEGGGTVSFGTTCSDVLQLSSGDDLAGHSKECFGKQGGGGLPLLGNATSCAAEALFLGDSFCLLVGMQRVASFSAAVSVTRHSGAG